MGPILYDAVTLQHFAAASRLDILKTRHKNRPTPRWTYGVYQEIKRAADTIPHCTVIIEEPWLGEPKVPTERQAEEIDLIRMSIMELGDTRYAHLGEAQSIYFAKQLQGQFATDDNTPRPLRLRHFLAWRRVSCFLARPDVGYLSIGGSDSNS